MPQSSISPPDRRFSTQTSSFHKSWQALAWVAFFIIFCESICAYYALLISLTIFWGNTYTLFFNRIPYFFSLAYQALTIYEVSWRTHTSSSNIAIDVWCLTDANSIFYNLIGFRTGTTFLLQIKILPIWALCCELLFEAGSINVNETLPTKLTLCKALITVSNVRAGALTFYSFKI